jgi:hypothetical protein
MDTKDLTEAQRRDLRRLERYLGRHFPDLLPHINRTAAGGLRYADGTLVQFDVPDNRNVYRYYEDARTGARYAYTPWRDTRGWYWAFDYAPAGKGARSGDPERLEVKNAVKFRKRKAAKARALRRYEKRTKGHE